MDNVIKIFEKNDKNHRYEIEGNFNGIVPAILIEFLKNPDKKIFVSVLKDMMIFPLGMNILHYFAINNELICL